MEKQLAWIRVLAMALTLVAILVIAGTGGFYSLGTVETMTAMVTDKDRSCEVAGDGEDCVWMILTDKMSFENRDSLYHLKFRSTDFQGRIALGKTYEFTYTGKRIPLLSWYPNIIEAKQVQPQTNTVVE